MFIRMVFAAALAAATLLGQQEPTDARGWIGQGVAAFKAGRYDDAVGAFRRAVDLDPGNVTAHLYLGTAYMQQYIPGADTPQNLGNAANAQDQFERVLGLQADNKIALASLGSLALNQKKWEDARTWYNRLIGVDPNNREAYYTLGFIAWSQWYPAYGAARTKLGMRQEQPGPLPEGAVKQELRGYEPMLEEGMGNLRRALEIDPQYDDAMAYLNLLIRERADLRATPAEYQSDVREADEWVAKALDTKRRKAESGQRSNWSAAPPPPPPPGSGPRVRMNPDAMQIRNHIDPVYPPLARQAHIQGTVRFEITVDREGSVKNVQVISGHPLLIPAAIDAIKQWTYQPVLLNGEPVEVTTMAEVYFTLGQ